MRTKTSHSKIVSGVMCSLALLLVVLTAGCDRDHGATPAAVSTVPTVIFTVPANGAVNVPLNRKVSATFSIPMSAATITAPGTFTITGPGATVVTASSLTYDAATRVALFTPVSNLTTSTTYIAKITVAATSAAGTEMASDYMWSFTTGTATDTASPLLLITAPVNAATGVPVNQKITATFNEPMDATTITPATYTVTGPTGTIAGTISYLGATATFTPVSLLTASTTYTVEIAADDLAGNPLVAASVPNPWSFTTIAGIPPFVSVNLGLATPFAIAATAGVVNTGATLINGDVVLDPNQTCNAVVVDNAGGFGLCNGVPPTINGTVITNLYPDTTTAAAVKADLNAGYLSITPPAGPPAAGSLGGATNLPAGTTLGAPTGNALVQGDNYFVPGVYQSLTSILITDDVTLDGQGDPNATFIFQSSSTLGTADGSIGTHPRILLTGGTKASNVWWQVGSSATIGTYTEFYGNILAAYDITMKTGATACGRSMAGAWVGGAGAFVFDSNSVSVPGHPNAPVGCE